MSYEAKILADSISDRSVRLTTLQVTFPRIVLAEFNTHRQFSRNSASSRAIPVEKQLKKLEEGPFMPVYWGRNQKGMSAEQELTREEQGLAAAEWNTAKHFSINQANRLLQIGVHKQITNRILEPWMWQTVIVTATEWENFFNLRCHPAAQPEIRKIAEMMRQEMKQSAPVFLDEDDWHLPLVPDEDQLRMAGFDPIKVCVGRCARVSYLTHEGKRDPQADVDLANSLLANGHMSPWEHAATPFTDRRYDVMAFTQDYLGNLGRNNEIDRVVASLAFEGNFRGWTQARKLIQGEAVFRGTTS